MRRVAATCLIAATLAVLHGCGGKAEPAASPAGEPARSGGTIKMTHENATTDMAVGAGYATLYKVSGGTEFLITLYNDGATGTSCASTIEPDTAIGGTNWALELETYAGTGVTEGSKDPVEVTPTIYLVATSGVQKGEPQAWRPGKAEVTITQLTDTQIAGHVAGEWRDSSVNGDFSAKVCKVETDEAQAP